MTVWLPLLNFDALFGQQGRGGVPAKKNYASIRLFFIFRSNFLIKRF
jgi:hypothetical protein